MGEFGYIAMYRGKKYEVYAKSSYDAQQKMAKYLKAKKSYEVDVYLCEKPNGKQVTTTITN